MSQTTRGEAVAKLLGVVAFDDPGVVLSAAAARLTRRGVGVRFLTPPLPECAEPYRLLVLRAKSPEVTRWAKRQQAEGAAVVPDPATIELVKDRWTCRHMLGATRVQLPDALMGTAGVLLDSGVERLLPLVLKHRRLHQLPVSVIHTADELRAALGAYDPGEELVAEHYIEGLHYTACFIGESVHVFLKQPMTSGVCEVRRVSAPPTEIVDCLNCYREVSRLPFGKVDVVCPVSGGAFFVDGGVSPNLWQFPEAAQCLADYFMTFFENVAAVNPVARVQGPRESFL